MSERAKNEDIRVTKTDDAIHKSFTALLEKRTFSHLTILDICREALISRATFYAHYNDKYDLLKCWLHSLGIPNWTCSYEEIEVKINSIVYNNKKIMRNIIVDSNEETLYLICDWIIDDLILCNRKDIAFRDEIALNFCAGGILRYLNWQVRERFPQSVPFMNRTVYSIINSIIK